MKAQATFNIRRIALVALTALAPVASSQAAGDSVDPFHRIGYLAGEQNALSAPASVARGVAGPIKAMAGEGDNTFERLGYLAGEHNAPGHGFVTIATRSRGAEGPIKSTTGSESLFERLGYLTGEQNY
jgi:hypothetical protein